MVNNATTTGSTGFSIFEPTERAGKSATIHRGPILDLERNVGDGNDYHRHGLPGKKLWKLHMRPPDDDLPQDWWFASTAIPLLAATIGPLANVLSIAALVTTWRVTLPDNGTLPLGKDENGIAIADPHWEVVWNTVSLACGFAGNIALLFNFTRRIRYIVALPLTIIFWYLATGILIGITVAMNEFDAPIRPGQTYSQGFWYAVFAGCLYLFGSMILMINMFGYFLGHYPQHFDLDDDQRTLILQTMMFFFWLAGGAGVFHAVCGFSYVDALYFCDVTVLTIGFGDFVADNNVSRGLVFPYSVGGIIFLGLVINSIRNFAVSMSRDNIVKAHQRRERERTVGRTVTSERSLRLRLGIPPRMSSEIRGPRSGKTPSGSRRRGNSLSEFGTLEQHGHVVTFHQKVPDHRNKNSRTLLPAYGKTKGHQRDNSSMSRRIPSRREKILVLREEKDRFDAMRRIQQNTKKFKQYYALSMSVLAFGILWCIGALVFMYAERRQQNLSYFEALYFCYVSLLTIGYGDFSPQSNIGKPFFVVWSLIAVPTMTILISDMGETVISAIKRGTFTVADWTVLPRAGVWHDFVMKHPRLHEWLQKKQRERAEKKRIERGFQLNNPDEQEEEEVNPLGSPNRPLTLEELAKDGSSDHDLARKLAVSIKKVANDLKTDPPVRYGYEEWVEFTRLIRFSTRQWGRGELAEVEEEEGLVEWDWIGENSPMLADVTESQWVLDRLCESLNRYTRREAQAARDVIEGTNNSDWEWRRRRHRRGSLSSGDEDIRLTMDGRGSVGRDVSPGHVSLSSDSQQLDPVVLAEEAEKLSDGDLSCL